MRVAVCVTMVLLAAWVLGCGTAGEKPPGDPQGESLPANAGPQEGGRSTGLWDGEVRVYGVLRAMMHEGRTEARVSLDAMLPSPDLYAVGALAGLAGEITVAGGQAYLSRAAEGDRVTTEVTTSPGAGAALLVAARVPAWSSVTVEEPIPFEEFDEAIGRLADSAGMSLDARFPFLLEGEFEELQWHVIDGSRLPPGASSHRDHLSAGVREQRRRSAAVLVGFYSGNDQGVFTHKGSKTHLHAVLDQPLSSGHVDHVVIPAGVTVRFPLLVK